MARACGYGGEAFPRQEKGVGELWLRALELGWSYGEDDEEEAQASIKA